MAKQYVEISENDFPSKEKIWDKLYQCRDFELSSFWQKSVFIFSIFIVCFTGYGGLVSAAIDPENKNSLLYIYQYMCGVSLLGIITSILWIYMMKGSKAWYEVYEKSIYAIEREIFEIENGKYVMGKFAKKMRGDFGLDFWSNKPGAFSPSKINIVIGWVLLFVWGICEGCSIYNLMVCKQHLNVSMSLLIYFFITAIIIVIIQILIKTWIKSKPLLPQKLHKSGKFREEYNYKPFITSIRELIDNYVEEKTKNIGNDCNDFTFDEKKKNEITKLIQTNIDDKINDLIYEEYENLRYKLLTKSIDDIVKERIKKAKDELEKENEKCPSTPPLLG